MYLSAWLNLKKKIEKNMNITYVWLVTPIMIREKCIGQIYLVQMNKISLFFLRFFHDSSINNNFYLLPLYDVLLESLALSRITLSML